MRYLVSALSLVTLCSCSKKEPPLVGKREDVIVSSLALEISKNAGDVRVMKSNGNPYIGTFAFSKAPKKLWEYKFYDLALNGNIMACTPVVESGCVYAMDAGGIVHCVDQKTGKLKWNVFTTTVGETGQSGSAMGYIKKHNLLLVSTSFGECFVINASNGNVVKRIKLPAPCKGDGILVDGDIAYFNCSSNTVCAIDIITGKKKWEYAGIDREDGYIGMSKPVIFKDTLIITTASGELLALKKSDGHEIWRIIISNFSVKDSISAIAHIRATPVVEDGIVYVTSNTGILSAVNASTGDVIWSKDIGGLTPVNITGDHIFVVNNRAELACLHKRTGAVRSIHKLNITEKKASLLDKILFRTPTTDKEWFAQFLTNHGVLHISHDGEFIISDYKTGAQFKPIQKSMRPISFRPVLKDGVMYILSDDGYITAYLGN